MRQVLVLSGLLAAALAASAWTWSHSDDVTPDATKVAMYRADAKNVQKLVYKAEDLEVTLERKSDANGDYTWITSTETVKKAKPPTEGDTDTDAGEPVDGGETETKTMAFLGNDTALKLWASFSPLMALRELPDDPANAATFGLDAPKATLDITRNDGLVSLQIGGETWGSRDRYVKADGKVFLVDDQDLRPIQYGKTRLVERSVQPLIGKDVRTITVERSGTTTSFTQKNAEDAQKAKWVRDSSPDVGDTVGGTWLDKLMKVKIQGYPTEIPANLEPVFKFTVTGENNSVPQSWDVEVFKETGETTEYWAKSAYSRATVRLTRSQAQEAVDDIDAVLSSTPTEAPPEAPKPADGASGVPEAGQHPGAASPAEKASGS